MTNLTNYRTKQGNQGKLHRQSAYFKITGDTLQTPLLKNPIYIYIYIYYKSRKPFSKHEIIEAE